MFNTIKLILATLFLAPVLTGAAAQAQFDPFAASCADNPDATVCEEKEQQQDSGDNPLTGTGSTLETVANFLALITAVIAVIVIIVAGIQMIVSSGDSGKIQNARNAIIYAAVGLVVIALARGIIIFVIERT